MVYVSRMCTSTRNRCNNQSIDISKIYFIDEIGYFTFCNNSDVISANEARSNSIFIFDNVTCDQQDAVREYFSMGLHANVDCFYFCQTYARIPKHLICDNANLLILFKQDYTNLKHVYNDHVNTDMSYDEFYLLCRDKKKYGFLLTKKIWIFSDR